MERTERATLLAVALAGILAPLNSTMLAVALPAIVADFNADIATAGWLMTGYLLWRENRLFHTRQRRNLSQLGTLHITQTLGILRQPDMTHATLHVVNEPPLAIHRHHRNVAPYNVTIVIQYLGA